MYRFVFPQISFQGDGCIYPEIIRYAELIPGGIISIRNTIHIVNRKRIGYSSVLIDR